VGAAVSPLAAANFEGVPAAPDEVAAALAHHRRVWLLLGMWRPTLPEDAEVLGVLGTRFRPVTTVVVGDVRVVGYEHL
jgi:hypothetical protein